MELGQEIAEGKLNPVELAEETLEKIEAHSDKDRIFARVTFDRAIREAHASYKRQKGGDLLSLLDGVPISWKDLFDTAGIATVSGSKLLADRVPPEDCKPVELATSAGLVCVGKTHLSELAFSGLGINPSTATSPNIHGEGLAPGGSSSGAAASVAHGLVPIGVGSDTGGSVRIPSAWNNLTGFKTTHGMISLEGVVPLCSGFDTVGPLCIDVSDAWTITAIMSGIQPELPSPKPIEQCRFLISETVTLDDLGSDQNDGFLNAVEKLQRAGAYIKRSPIPEIEEIQPLGPILFPYEAWQQWGDVISRQPELMFEPVRNRFESGRNITQEQYETAWTQMMVMRETYNNRTEIYDAVLAPTVPIAPPEVTSLLEDYDLFSATNMKALRNTRIFNVLGCCALTLPTERPASGLMVATTGGKDRDLASVGLAIENVLKAQS